MKSAALSLFRRARQIGLIPVCDYELEDFPPFTRKAAFVKALAEYCERSAQKAYEATKEVDICTVEFFTTKGDPAGAALIVHGNDLDEEVSDHTTQSDRSAWIDEWSDTFRAET